MAGACGSCTACCRTMGIGDMEPVKPRNQPCPHCPKGATGCNIYATRPESCRTYECVWLQSQEQNVPMPRYLRPDQCRVVINPGATDDMLVLEVDTRFPGAWLREPIRGFIGLMLRDAFEKLQRGEPYTRVIISVGNDRRIITGFRNGKFVTRKMKLLGEDADGVARYEYDDEDPTNIEEIAA